MNSRNLAYQALLEIEKGAYANLVLDEYLRENKLSGPERGLATELTYGSVKYKLLLDWLIGRLVAKPGKLKIGPRIILRMAFYQLLFLDRIPPSAATNEAVKMAKKYFNPGVAGLINGVLRGYLRDPAKVKWPVLEDDPVKYLSIKYSHPEWMIERWLKRYGHENTRQLCEFNNRPADLWIRTNTLLISRDELMAKLEQEGCQAEVSRRVPEGIRLVSAPPLTSLESFQAGYFTVQDESSMLVAHALNPKPASRVIDVCAGPGGKTSHLAQLMDNRGLIIACDIHRHRLGLIEDTAQRLGIGIIETRLQDATKLEVAPGEEYPYILVDAPCSGLGVLRRRPDSRWRKKPEDIGDLAALQIEIMKKAVKTLQPGGWLIYSTCTIEPEENNEVITKITAQYPEMELIDLRENMPYQAEGPQEEEELSAGMRQYLPFADEMEGFFLAGLRKRSN
ncbi:MAG: 16S rRNA (cytosine(967)-C(5))-methyltransferase RsmB [Peptococcia bacterium]